MLIKNGLAATSEGVRKADLRAEGEVILEIAGHLDALPGEEVIDAEGLWVLPGGIDAHTHFDMPFGDNESTADDFLTGTRAAVLGGTTTVLDFPEPTPDETMADGLALWHKKADGRSFCDYNFHMTVSAWNVDDADGYRLMAREGVTSFKAYTAYYDSIGIRDDMMYRAFKAIKEVGGILLIHCENGDLLNAKAAELASKETARVRSHADSRPNLVEAEAVSRVMDIASLAEAPVYVVHVSTGDAISRIAARKAAGQAVYAETCPHYLLFDASEYDSNDLRAAGFVMSPPLRAPEDEERLWAGIKDGEVDLVSTDHCVFTLEQKKRGLDDFRNLPGGVMGAETRLELMYHFGTERGLDIGEIARLTAEDAARIFGLYPKKGVLAPGSDADIVIIDPDSPHTLSAATQATATDYTIYEGIAVSKKVKHVIRRGKHIMTDGALTEEEPGGQFVRCGSALQTGLKR